jgi:hypothetical protein
MKTEHSFNLYSIVFWWGKRTENPLPHLIALHSRKPSRSAVIFIRYSVSLSENCANAVRSSKIRSLFNLHISFVMREWVGGAKF